MFPKIMYFVVFKICWDYSLHLIPKGKSSQYNAAITSGPNWRPYEQFPTQKAITGLSEKQNNLLAILTQRLKYTGKTVWKISTFIKHIGMGWTEVVHPDL